MADKLACLRNEMSGAAHLPPQYVEAIRIAAAVVQRTSENLHLAASSSAAKRCIEVTDSRHPSGSWSENGINALAFTCAQLAQTIQDELEAQLIFSLSSTSAQLVQDGAPRFGEEVANAFPLAVEDVEESGRCLAFGRYTATVFHLMRAMEAAVQALASRVGADSVEKEWGKLLSDIGAAVEAMPKGPERNRWSESHSHLYHVKQAWRNDTMHPKKTYTEDEARAVYQAVRSFMMHLAPLV